MVAVTVPSLCAPQIPIAVRAHEFCLIHSSGYTTRCEVYSWNKATQDQSGVAAVFYLKLLQLLVLWFLK